MPGKLDSRVCASVVTPGGLKVSIQGENDDVAKLIKLLDQGGDPGTGIGEKQITPRPPRIGAPTIDYEGVAELNEAKDGVNMLVSDLKANTAADAAKRLSHVFLLANKDLVGRDSVPTRELTTLLTEYGITAGSTRDTVSKDKRLLYKADMVSLARFAEPEARQFVKDAQNAELKGKWSPGTKQKRTKK